MHAVDLDQLLWPAADAGQVLLLLILIARRLYRIFPVFSAYILWQLMSDLVLYLALSMNEAPLRHHYVPLYYSLNLVTYLFEFGVLLEIGSHVLRPATRVLPQSVLYLLLGITLTIGTAYFVAVAWLNPTRFANVRLFLVMDTTAAVLCLVSFLLIAGFSQVLGLTWKSHVLQLATGLAFYSVIDLVVELMRSQLHAGPSYARQYQLCGLIQISGYFCTVFFWCYALLKKEAPRKEFSPQMEKVLVYISGSAKRQSSVLARLREP